MDGCSHINTARCEHLPKKTKVTQYYLQQDYQKDDIYVYPKATLTTETRPKEAILILEVLIFLFVDTIRLTILGRFIIIPVSVLNKKVEISAFNSFSFLVNHSSKTNVK